MVSNRIELGAASPWAAIAILTNALLLTLPPRADAGVERAIALRGVRLEIPAAPARENVTIVVRDGVVRAIGEDVAIPPDARVLDGAGLTVAPAFLDSWSVAASAELPKVEVQNTPRPVDEGVVFRMDPDSRVGRTPEAEVQLAFPWKEAKKWREAGFGGFLAVPQGTGLRGSSRVAWWIEEDATANEATLAVDVFQHVDLSISGPGYPSTLMGVLAAYRQYFADAERNASIASGYEARARTGERPRIDRGFDALLSAREARRPFVVRADTKGAIRSALAFCREHGLVPAIVGGAEAGEVAAELKAAGAFVLVTLDFPKKPDQEETTPAPTDDVDERGHCDDCCTSGAHAEAHFAQDPAPPVAPQPLEPVATDAEPKPEGGELKNDAKKDAKKKRPEFPAAVLAEREADRNRRIANAATLAAAGVPFAFTAKDLKSPADFRKNLKLAIEAGLARDTALAALTKNAADLLGASDVLGDIAIGRPAAFTAWKGDPLDPESKVRWLVLGSERFEFELPKDDPKAKASDKPATDVSAATNVTGAWAMRIDMGDSAREYQLTFDQKDGRLSGTTISGSGSSGEVTGGSVSGDAIEFTIVIAPAGRHYEFVYSGKVAGDQMNGTVAINGGEGHPFSATRATNPQEGN